MLGNLGGMFFFNLSETLSSNTINGQDQNLSRRPKFNFKAGKTNFILHTVMSINNSRRGIEGLLIRNNKYLRQVGDNGQSKR